MSMLKRAANLQQSMQELAVLRGISSQAHALRSRADQFADAHARIRAALGHYRVLTQNGIAISQNTGAIGLGKYALDLKAKVESDPAVVLSPDLDVGPKFLQPLKLLSERLERDVAAAWSSWIDEQIPQIGSALLEILGRIPDFKAPIAVVRSKLQRLAAIAKTLPASEQDVTAARTLAAESKDAWAGLNADSLPHDVLEFLRDAGTIQGASLGKLTPSVRTHLERYQMENSFTVRTR